ncbi:hypothetical protein CJ030_MR7G010697 [Morella rubra]|uniref:Uncharacterized protein n=1 Tax=Morella rubra TaxID=262757 RepID=A0A6A1UY86_9ROSI|nr:hypothetical protein CJ030_MR7G010704 [Morella rubra]KAB1205362.1 hypothetical protein CJ030_MR7G010697 [Morella rubra]
MTSAIGWYGPLIDLSEAALHVGDFVQLLVFVHRSTPVQYKLAKGGEVIKTDIQVGDNTRPFFSVSLWQKPIGSMALAGDVVLLQNVKITKFGGVVEAKTVQCSSLQSLIHLQELLFSKGADDLIADCRLGITTKEKLRKVIEWVQRAGSTLCKIDLQSHQNGRIQKLRKYELISQMDKKSKARLWFSLRQLQVIIPKNGGLGTCGRGDKELYVWDESGYLPLLVRNKAAEILFGNIRAERVYFCYREQNQCGNPDPKDVHKDDQCSAHVFDHPKAAAGFLGSCLPDADRNLEWKAKQCCGKKMNFYLMWLIFLKILLQQGNNSPLKIEVTVNANLDRENGRFEMVSVLMPCFRAK